MVHVLKTLRRAMAKLAIRFAGQDCNTPSQTPSGAQINNASLNGSTRYDDPHADDEAIFRAQCETHAAKCEAFYERYWSKPRHSQSLAYTLWANDPEDLAHVFGKYFDHLIYTFEHMIKASTVRRWGLCMIYLAEQNTPSDNSHSRGVRRPFKGLNTDALSHHLTKKIEMLIKLYRLDDSDLPDEQELYGPDECTLAVRHLESELVSNPHDAVALLQQKALHQLCLSCGPEAGSLVPDTFVAMRFGAERNLLRQGCIRIFQYKRGSYRVEVNVWYPPPFRSEVETAVEFNPRFWPVTRPGNLQLELASTVIPLSIHRGALHTIRDGTKYFFKTLEDFYQATESYFFLDEPDTPFFRAVNAAGQLSGDALSYCETATDVEILGLATNLPNASLKNYRAYVAETALSAWGLDTQTVVLNRHTDKYGRLYSEGVAGICVSGAVMGEYDLIPSFERDNLQGSGLMKRTSDKSAMSAVRRTHLVTGQHATKLPSTSTPGMDAALVAVGFGDAVKRLRGWKTDREKTGKWPVPVEEVGAARAEIARGRRRAIKRLSVKNRQSAVEELDHEDRKKANGDTRACATVLEHLRQAPPFLLATLNHGHTTLDSEINALWPQSRKAFWSRAPDTTADPLASFWPSPMPDDSADSIGALRFEYMKKQLAYLQKADPR